MGPQVNYSIEEGFAQLSQAPRLSGRAEFRDPLISSLEHVSLSSKINEELDRFYNPNTGPVELITRVFRRFRRSGTPSPG